MTLTHNITALQGEDTSFTFRINRNNQALDLTGAQAKLQVRKKANTEDVFLELTHTDGITLDGITGTVDILGGKTEMLPPGVYVYDLFVLVQGRRYAPVSGIFTLKDAVTDTKEWQ